LSTYYLLGPMSGIPGNNVEAFSAAAATLRGLGYGVLSPAELDDVEGLDPERELTPDEYARVLARDLSEMTRLVADGGLDGGVALEGWEASRGALGEAQVLRALGKPILQLTDTNSGVVLSPVLEGRPSVTRHPASARFHELIQTAADLHDVKQGDYGRGDDPFANVRASADWGVPEWVGAMVRATDKVRRLQTYAERGTLANEGVLDAFLDLAVYSLIAAVLWEDAQTTE
jgi:hypothetical protein